MPTCGSPGLFAAYRVLRRQSVPWHPPCALFRLICLRAPALPPLSRPLRFSRSDTSTFLRLLRSVRISSFGLCSALPTGFLPRFPSTSFGFFFPCAVFKVRLRLPPSLPVCLSLPLPFPLPAAFEVSLFSDPSKRYSEEFPSDASPLSLRWLYRSYSLSTRRFSIGSPIIGSPISCRSFRLSRFASAFRLSPSRFRSPLRPRMRMNSPSIPFSLERR